MPSSLLYLFTLLYLAAERRKVCACVDITEKARKRTLALSLPLLCLRFVVVLIGRPLDGLLIMDHHVTFVCVSFVHGKGFTKRHNKAKAKQKQSEGKANSKSHDPLRTIVSIIVHTVPGSSFLLPSHTHPV